MSDLAAYPPASRVFAENVVSSPKVGSKDHVFNNQHGTISTKLITLTGSGGIANNIVFTVTETIEVFKLQGFVSTALQNCGTASLGFFDGSVTTDITQPTPGATLTNFVANSWVGVTGTAGAALTVKNANAGYVFSPTTNILLQPLILGQKSGATSTVEFTYTTSNTPTSGAIQFEMWWRPLTTNAAVV